MDDEYDIPIEIPKNDYELFIESLELKLNKEYSDYLIVNAKVLHDSEKINLNFKILIYEDTKMNPFENDILFNVEYIHGEQPYIQILSNFIRPTMYDFKNYYLCLSSKFDYIFNSTSLSYCQLSIEEIVSNIKYFLYHIKELDNFKIFMYFGEYNMDHIYQMNDFMRNSEKIDFFRVNQIKEDQFIDKILYIVCTEIYFIVFEPVESNKSLGKILFYSKLSELEFHFEEIGYSIDKKEMKKRLKIVVFDNKNRILFNDSNYEYKYNTKVQLFKLSTLNHYINNTINISSKVEYLNLEKNTNSKTRKNSKTYKNKINLNSNPNIINDNSEISYSSKNTFEFLFLYKDEYDGNETLILQNQYVLFKKFISKQKILDDIGYPSVISFYGLLFGHKMKPKILNESLPKTKEEFDKLINYNEKLYEKYKDSKKEFDKKRIKILVKNIIFLCSTITGLLSEDNEINLYIDLMRKYATKMKK